MNGEMIIDWWVNEVLPVIWVIFIIGYIWAHIMWKMGKWKIVYKNKETNETSKQDS